MKVGIAAAAAAAEKQMSAFQRKITCGSGGGGGGDRGAVSRGRIVIFVMVVAVGVRGWMRT